MRPFSSAGSVSLILKNHPSPVGSSLTSAGDSLSTIDLDNFTRSWRIDLGGGLDAFDRCSLLAFFECFASGRQLDEHDVAKLRLRIIGDPDDSCISFGADIFVSLGVVRCHRAFLK